jgi:DNA-binding transcriptional LysR family regulator
LPSTAALLAFEAAARHESFTRAAEELALTQSAICRQIARWRTSSACRCSAAPGAACSSPRRGSYSRQIAPRLDAIERDTLAVMAHHGAGSVLELAVVPTFATRWLLPRLAALPGAESRTWW